MSSGKTPYFSDANMNAFINDYVDGVMDDTTREAFEELLATDLSLKAKVCHLKEMRDLMCGLNCGCNLDATDIAAEIRKKVYQNQCEKGIQLPLWLLKDRDVRLGVGIIGISVIMLVLTGGAFFASRNTKVQASTFILPSHKTLVAKASNKALPSQKETKSNFNICPNQKK